MTDWMEDLLAMLPAPPPPNGLPARLRSRIALQRRHDRRTRWAGRIALLGTAASGAWMMAPSLAGMEALLPRYSVRAIGDWAALSFQSPPMALNQAAGSFLAWGTGAIQGLGPASILALALIAVPALFVAASLASEGRRPKEGLL